MGVRRAMEMVLTEANKGRDRISTLGPLIHNRQVMDLLESKGITSHEDIDEFNEGTLVIRAHGIPPDQRRELRESGLRLIAVTGRPLGWIDVVVHHWPVEVGIGENGAGWVWREDSVTREGYFEAAEEREKILWMHLSGASYIFPRPPHRLCRH